MGNRRTMPVLNTGEVANPAEYMAHARVVTYPETVPAEVAAIEPPAVETTDTDTKPVESADTTTDDTYIHIHADDDVIIERVVSELAAESAATVPSDMARIVSELAAYSAAGGIDPALLRSIR